MTQTQHPQRGSALLYILIAIALLTALTVSLTRMSSNSGGNLEPEQARLKAQQIVAYAKSVESAVQFVGTQNNCGQAQISFENPVEGSYTNASAPTDKRCHVFDIAGGGLSWNNPPKSSTVVGNETWFFEGNGHSITGFGTEGSGLCGSSCTDLIMVLPNVETSVCQQINFLLGVTTSLSTTPPNSYTGLPATAAFTTKFTGNYGTATGSRIGIGGLAHYLKPMACVRAASGTVTYLQAGGTSATASGANIFFALLLAR